MLMQSMLKLLNTTNPRSWESQKSEGYLSKFKSCFVRTQDEQIKDIYLSVRVKYTEWILLLLKYTDMGQIYYLLLISVIRSLPITPTLKRDRYKNWEDFKTLKKGVNVLQPYIEIQHQTLKQMNMLVFIVTCECVKRESWLSWRVLGGLDDMQLAFNTIIRKYNTTNRS